MPNPLHKLIVQRVHKKGPISVADYMQLALTHPDYGYYTTRNPLGRAGDFVTSPEISQVFGELLGLWCVDVWQQSGMPAARLVELGPGRGTLMQDALRAMRKIPGATSQLSVHLVEVNPVLRELQQAQLQGMGFPVIWHDTLEEALGKDPVFCLANEFFDALPVRQYELKDGQWYERLIGVDDSEQLCFVTASQPEPLIEKKDLEYGESNPVIEINRSAEKLTEKLCRHIKRYSGAALIVDYGYAEGHGDTLQAVSAHQYHPVLEKPGDADLTAHVDFSALSHVAQKIGIRTHGPTTQGAFLRELGAQLRAMQLAKDATAEQKQTIHAGVTRLTAPEAMGELFKILAVTHPSISQVSGFTASL